MLENLPASAGDMRDPGLIPGLGRFPGEGHGNPLQYSCPENPMDRGAWWATVHRVAKSRTRLKRLSNDRSGPGSPGTIRLFPGWLAPHRPVRHRCLLLTRTTLPLPQVVAERVLCPAAREPWLLQGCEGSQCRSAVPRRSACQPGQGPGQRGL